MKKYKKWIMAFAVMVVSVFIFMGVNVFNVTQLPCAIQITKLDEACTVLDQFDARYVGGIKVTYIFFTPGATGDIVTIKDTDTNGPVLCRFVAADIYDQRTIPFDGDKIRPYIETPAAAPNVAAFITIKLSDDN